DLEEGRTFRRRTTKTASSLSVWLRAHPIPRLIPGAWPFGFLRRLHSRGRIRPSPHLNLDRASTIGCHLDCLATAQPLFQDRRLCPLLIPAIFDGHDRVPARRHRRQREGAVAVALISPK